jgi:hypothetical protein
MNGPRVRSDDQRAWIAAEAARQVEATLRSHPDLTNG